MSEIKGERYSLSPPRSGDDKLCRVGFTWEGEEVEIYGEEAWSVIQRAKQIRQEIVIDEFDALTQAIRELLDE